MNMREHFRAFYRVVANDETLLRLLHYKPTTSLEDPLSLLKPNILGLPNRWEITNNVINTTPKTDDLTTKSQCRLFIYLGRRGNTHNYLMATQEVTFDVLVGMDWHEIDQRQLAICDRINELVNQEFISGVTRTKYKTGVPISAPEGFLGYRLVYEIGSMK